VYTAGDDNYRHLVGRYAFCYDLRFLLFSLVMWYKQYDYFFMWRVGSKTRIKAWDTSLVPRAIENMSYAVAVNRIGSDANAYEYDIRAIVLEQLCTYRIRRILISPRLTK
jgi:predicted amidohydrolase